MPGIVAGVACLAQILLPVPAGERFFAVALLEGGMRMRNQARAATLRAPSPVAVRAGALVSTSSFIDAEANES